MPQCQRNRLSEKSVFILGLMAGMVTQPLPPNIDLKHFFYLQNPVTQSLLGFMYVLGSL